MAVGGAESLSVGESIGGHREPIVKTLSRIVKWPYLAAFPFSGATVSGLALTLCGRISATIDGQSPPGEPLGGKALALIAYLALEPGVHTRDELTALLWGEFPEHQAKASLRQALTHLRHAIGNGVCANRTSVELAAPVERDGRASLGAAKGDPRAALGAGEPRFAAGLGARHGRAF